MTAAIQDILSDKLGTEDLPPPALLALPCEANKQIFGGTMCASNAAGNCVNAGDPTALIVWGRCERQVNNLATNVPYGAAGAQNVNIRPGVYYLAQDGSISAANVGQACYAVDDNTVSLSPVGTTAMRPFAGIIQPPGQGIAGTFLTTNTKVPVYLGYPSCVGQVLHATFTIPLATITTKTSGTAFAVGVPLPANARLIGSEINVLTALSGGGLSACTASLAGGADAAGTIVAAASVFTGAAPVVANVGSNPYEARGGQQINMTLTATGATLAAVTAGSLSVDLFYTIVP